MSAQREILTALAGNPNCGKSTIFNALTGARQTVGNFPGVTVDRYEGVAFCGGEKIRIIDLPGVYSLASFSDEERVAAEYLCDKKPNVIVNIVDASNLERNLFLTLMLLELNRPMIVVLNMVDVAARRGIEIDTAALSRELGVPVLKTIGNRAFGVEMILDQIVETAKGGEMTDDERAERQKNVSRYLSRTEPLDSDCASGCQSEKCCVKCQAETTRNMAADLARYNEAARIGIRCVRSAIRLERSFSDRVDLVLTNRYVGIPIFLLMMYAVFQLTFTLGEYPMDWIERGFAALSAALNARWPAESFPFLKSLVIDGVIGGVGGVLVFLPNILLLFLAVSVLEDSGYMARAALLSDRWMHKIGLPGRSVVPLLVGFGCTVPALMATKMLTDRRERLTTMFVLPLFSCGARLPIYALLIPAFFPPAWRGPMLWLIYLIGIVLAAVIAKLMSLSFTREEESLFVVELPTYHFPTFRTVGVRTLERGWQYVKKAGTVILGISVVLWFLTAFPQLSPEQRSEFEARRQNAERTITDAERLAAAYSRIDDEEARARTLGSYAGRLGKVLEPAIRPMGFDWKIGTALVGAFAAKEVFVAQMGIVCAAGDSEGESGGRLSEILAREYTPLTGFCVILVLSDRLAVYGDVFDDGAGIRLLGLGVRPMGLFDLYRVGPNDGGLSDRLGPFLIRRFRRILPASAGSRTAKRSSG